MREAETIYQLEEILFAKQDPEGYALKVKEFQMAEKEAQKLAGKHSHKSKCVLQ